MKAKELVNWSPGNMVAKTMLERIEQYQSLLSSILALANQAIQKRHWSKLFSSVGQPYDEEMVFTLAQLKQYNILAQESLITEVSTLATGEYALETSLHSIEQFWLKAAFELVAYHNKTKNIHILSGVEDIQRNLEDHEITLTNMLNSEYVLGIQKKVETMKGKLAHIAEVLEQWLLCQQKWCYLEPIFSQYEVQRQLQSQTAKFRVVDRKWRAIMRTAQKEPKVLIATSQGALLSTLTESNTAMEGILHGLESYLDTKRMAFPRFFFLSNDDIFDIISQNHNPHAIQQFLPKMFDNIKSLEFNR
jgi:dynein heavy chain